MSQVPRHRKLPTIEVPSVSVVVPVYNEARVLSALIPQLRKLAERCELVVADGGSTVLMFTEKWSQFIFQLRLTPWSFDFVTLQETLSPEV